MRLETLNQIHSYTRKTERQATLTHTCDSYSCKEEGDGGQCPVRLVSVSSHVYDRGRGRMKEGGGRCMVRDGEGRGKVYGERWRREGEGVW